MIDFAKQEIRRHQLLPMSPAPPGPMSQMAECQPPPASLLPYVSAAATFVSPMSPAHQRIRRRPISIAWPENRIRFDTITMGPPRAAAPARFYARRRRAFTDARLRLHDSRRRVEITSRRSRREPVAADAAVYAPAMLFTDLPDMMRRFHGSAYFFRVCSDCSPPLLPERFRRHQLRFCTPEPPPIAPAPLFEAMPPPPRCAQQPAIFAEAFAAAAKKPAQRIKMRRMMLQQNARYAAATYTPR